VLTILSSWTQEYEMLHTKSCFKFCSW